MRWKSLWRQSEHMPTYDAPSSRPRLRKAWTPQWRERWDQSEADRFLPCRLAKPRRQGQKWSWRFFGGRTCFSNSWFCFFLISGCRWQMEIALVRHICRHFILDKRCWRRIWFKITQMNFRPLQFQAEAFLQNIICRTHYTSYFWKFPLLPYNI